MFYIPYKICKHSLIIIDFIQLVYELFDINPSYSYWIKSKLFNFLQLQIHSIQRCFDISWF